MDLREVTEFLRDASKYIIAIGIVILLFMFIVAFTPVAGNSMVPTLEEGNVVLVQKLFKNHTKYQRNQIVVLKKNKKSYIKRIVGLPGEKVEYMNGVLYVDDVGYNEVFLKEGVETPNFLFEDICSKSDCPNGVIPDGMYMVLGDNRPESEDSRTPGFGLVSLKEIEGKVFFRIWPVTSLGGLN